MLSIVFCALIVQAQEVPPPDSNWESDPLDVIEPQKETTEPVLPEFRGSSRAWKRGGNSLTTDTPAPEMTESTPAPSDVAEPTHETAPTDTPEPRHAEAAPVETTTPVETAESFGSSGPDYSREAEFHRIYKTYNEQPTSVEAWEKAISSRQGEGYLVQKGDTLSGVSKTFFGDEFFWSKVWALNKDQILNPHEIKPGMNVQFFAGTVDDAPTLQLAQNQENPEDQVEAPVKAMKIVDADGNVTRDSANNDESDDS